MTSGFARDAAFTLPIPSSRGAVHTRYSFLLHDQNGWSRYLHFEAAWILVFTSLLYGAFGIFQGHFRRNLVPAPSDLAPKRLGIDIVALATTRSECAQNFKT
jgi:thiosulfate reductase cytochrome b subunit